MSGGCHTWVYERELGASVLPDYDRKGKARSNGLHRPRAAEVSRCSPRTLGRPFARGSYYDIVPGATRQDRKTIPPSFLCRERRTAAATFTAPGGGASHDISHHQRHRRGDRRTATRRPEHHPSHTSNDLDPSVLSLVAAGLQTQVGRSQRHSLWIVLSQAGTRGIPYISMH